MSSEMSARWSGLPIEPDRGAFLVPDEVAYFDTARLAPMLRRVRDAGTAALHRRAHPWEVADADWFTEVEHLRALAGQLVGDEDGEGVALVPATSDGFATAVASLPVPVGSTIIVLGGEYPSGIYTLRRHASRFGARIRTVIAKGGQDWTDAVLAAIDETTAIVSVPQVHWTDWGVARSRPHRAARS